MDGDKLIYYYSHLASMVNYDSFHLPHRIFKGSERGWYYVGASLVRDQFIYVFDYL